MRVQDLIVRLVLVVGIAVGIIIFVTGAVAPSSRFMMLLGFGIALVSAVALWRAVGGRRLL